MSTLNLLHKPVFIVNASIKIHVGMFVFIFTDQKEPATRILTKKKVN